MVTHGQITLPSDELFFDVLPKATVSAFKKCAEINFLSRDDWYLAGGTALALQAGHRRSVDLDFFSKQKTFDEKKIEELMSTEGKWITTSLSAGTVYGEFLGAKMSLIAYPFFKPALPLRTYGTISMVAPQDIGIMKLIAIAQRGRKRDFFDLYWLCKNGYALDDLISKVHAQYSVNQNLLHIIKSMVYFNDAESDPEPVIYFDASWEKVKDFFNREIPIIAHHIMR